MNTKHHITFRLSTVSSPPVSPSRLHFSLAILGIAVATLGTAGLGVTLWSCGLDPSRWFIITAAGEGREVSGWAVIAILASAIVAGASLTALAFRRKRRGAE